MSKLKTFLRKICLWINIVEADTLAMFSSVAECCDENTDLETDALKILIIEHLTKLENELSSYIPDLDEDKLFDLRNPFTANPEPLQPGTGNQEALIDLQHDQTARDVYSEGNLCNFWVKMLQSYTQLAEPAVQVLLLFPSTWLCESIFSILLGIKTKNRSNLKTTEHDIRCAVSKTTPRIDELADKIQNQRSY